MKRKPSVNDEVSRNTASMPTGGVRWWFWIAAGLLGCVIVASLVMKSADGTRQSGMKLDVRQISYRESSDKEIEQRRQTRAFELKAQKAVADVECRVRQFKRKISDIVEHYSNALPLADAEACFRRSESGVDFLASREGLCGFECSAISVAHPRKCPIKCVRR